MIGIITASKPFTKFTLVKSFFLLSVTSSILLLKILGERIEKSSFKNFLTSYNSFNVYFSKYASGFKIKAYFVLTSDSPRLFPLP